MLSFSAKATHIVGGEIQFLWTGRGNNYQLNLLMYFDDINAADGLIDNGITVYMFEKGTNNFVKEFPLPLKNQDNFVEYDVPGCEIPDLRTRILEYSKVFSFDPSEFTNPEGYYFEWERCCRNAIITNIQNPDEVGVTFYLEIPPLQKSNTIFRNSSPMFKPIKGEYFCLGKEQSYDFGATDANRDSLVYSLDTPFKGHSSLDFGNVAPSGNPAPYAAVDWEFGYGESNMIPGSPSLSIDPHTGVISVKPTQIGLFVMSVVVKEYRYGKEIGLSRRDFQFKVIQCAINPPPKVVLENPAGGYFSEKDTVVVPFGKEACFTADVSDSSSYMGNEAINLKKGGTLPASVFNLNPSSVILSPYNPVSKHNICINTCKTIVLERDSLFTLQVIASDKACPTPETDTLKTIFLLKGQEFHEPAIGLVPAKTSYNIKVKDSLSFVVFGTDQDSLDMLSLTMDGNGFDPLDLGMQFTTVTQKDSVFGIFRWIPSCTGLAESPLTVNFTVTDESCVPAHPQKVSVNFDVEDIPTKITEIRPTNLFTPNDDEHNDFYYIPDMPDGNCSSYFVGVTIYNRWGSLIFKSKDKGFHWDAASVPDGIYYYSIDLKSEVKKGWLQIVR